MTSDSIEPPLVSKRGWRYAPIAHTDERDFSTNLALTLSDLLEVPPEDLAPLSASIDPDVLDGLFAKAWSGGERVRTIQFPYQDRLVRIQTTPGSDFTVVGVEDVPPVDETDPVRS